MAGATLVLKIERPICWLVTSTGKSELEFNSSTTEQDLVRYMRSDEGTEEVK